MGQIVGLNAKPKRANLNALSLVPTPAAEEYILVSSDNSMNAVGQGNFDAYIVGDGQKAATALELKKINKDLYDLLDGVIPASQTDTYTQADLTEYGCVLADGTFWKDSDYWKRSELLSLQGVTRITYNGTVSVSSSFPSLAYIGSNGVTVIEAVIGTIISSTSTEKTTSYDSAENGGIPSGAEYVYFNGGNHRNLSCSFYIQYQGIVPRVEDTEAAVRSLENVSSVVLGGDITDSYTQLNLTPYGSVKADGTFWGDSDYWKRSEKIPLKNVTHIVYSGTRFSGFPAIVYIGSDGVSVIEALDGTTISSASTGKTVTYDSDTDSPIPANAAYFYFNGSNAKALSCVLTIHKENIDTRVIALEDEVVEGMDAINSRIETLDFTANNVINLVEFLGTMGEDFPNATWNQENGYVESTDVGVTNAFSLQKYVTILGRIIEWDFSVDGESNVAFFTQNAGFENFYSQGWFFSVDFATKSLNIHANFGGSTTPSIKVSQTFTLDTYVGVKLRLRIVDDKRTPHLYLYNLTDYSLLAEASITFENAITPTYGLGYDIAQCAVLSGSTMKVYRACVKAPKASNCFLYIVGDSITQGCGVPTGYAYADIVAKQVPNTIISGRGGATILSVIERITTEAALLHPKYVMVTIGTNGGNNATRLQQLLTAINGIGSIPIVNCIPMYKNSVTTTNNTIMALGVRCCRFDVATAVNYDISQGQDTGLFVSDFTHPNTEGYSRMAKRVMIDLPELF